MGIVNPILGIENPSNHSPIPLKIDLIVSMGCMIASTNSLNKPVNENESRNFSTSLNPKAPATHDIAPLIISSKPPTRESNKPVIAPDIAPTIPSF